MPWASSRTSPTPAPTTSAAATTRSPGASPACPCTRTRAGRSMHLGISVRESGYDNGQQRFRVRGPERAGLSTVWPLYANTGVFNGSGGQQDLNLESRQRLRALDDRRRIQLPLVAERLPARQAERRDALLLGRLRRGPLLPDRRAPRLHPRVGPLRPRRARRRTPTGSRARRGARTSAAAGPGRSASATTT